MTDEIHRRMISVTMLRLLTFGGLALESDDASSTPRPRPQRLAILAVLASAGDRGVSRERMAGLFWPDLGDERARHALRQALYALRQELGLDVIRSGTILTLDRSALSTDVGDFRAAVAAGQLALAAALAAGPFLDGFYHNSAPAFERWVEDERAVLAADATRVMLALAGEATSAGDRDAAAEWWRRLTRIDPLSGRFALGYLRALAARGDRAGALAFARAHENVVRRELEADADPEIRRLEAELRVLPSPEVVRTSPALALANAPPASGQPWLATPNDTPTPDARARRDWRVATAVVAAFGAVILVATLTADRWGPAVGLRPAQTPTFAVGMIREEGIPDTLRIGGVLTDMLATNLARVAGLSVLANTRLFELMRPGQDTLPAGYTDAARRAGATEILQGRLLAGPQWSMAMEIQRVDLTTGLVKGAYRIAAADRYALIDSMTIAIARDLRLGSPKGSVADVTTASPIAYRFYEEGLRAYYQYDEAAARRLMEAALVEDSTFAMAAYYVALFTSGSLRDEAASRSRALRLAARAPERERLRIMADLLMRNMEPSAFAVADSLAVKYPNDPRALQLLASSLNARGERRAAISAIERAIAIDSASEPLERQNCRLCGDFEFLADLYLWWDSLPAAERTAQRSLRARPKAKNAWHILTRAAGARGDTAAMHRYLSKFDEANPASLGALYVARQQILAEEYDQAEAQLRPLLDSPRPDEAGEARWLKSILLRNQGRIEETLRLSHVGGVNDLADALVALERGEARAAVSTFNARVRSDESNWAPGVQARHHAWHNTLLGMAVAAAGDTLTLRRLADTVEYWGQRSSYGRDRRAHHFLRGMLLVAEGRDADAAVELRDAMDSPSHGFTRVNYELGKTLMRLGRDAEAVSAVRSALHGDIDGSNLYMTRTDLHELLAQAFDRSGSRDSAAVHYRAVVNAWQHADPLYHVRRDRARAWLANPNAAKSH